MLSQNHFADHWGDQSAFSRCLVELDIRGIRKLWSVRAPHLYQPRSDREVLATMHHARTQAKSMVLRLRAYSHRWLTDNGYPSALPDELKPDAERIYPRVSVGVGISVNVRSELLKPIVPIVRGAMEDAVLEAEADKRLNDSEHVTKRMQEARTKAMKSIGLRDMRKP